MEMTPDDRFMERAAEKREKFESMSDEELEAKFLERLEDSKDSAQLAMFRARESAEQMLDDGFGFPDGFDESDDAAEIAKAIAEERRAEFEAREELLELRREQDLSREDLLMAFIESRGELGRDLNKMSQQGRDL